MDNFGEGLRKLVLAGIGAAAITGEKSQEVIDSLVKKGEITLEQGKVLNKEFQDNLKNKVDVAKEVAKEAAKAKKKDAEAAGDRKEVTDMIKGMSAEQIAKLKEFLETVKEDAAVVAADAAGAAEVIAAEVVEGIQNAAEDIKEAAEAQAAELKPETKEEESAGEDAAAETAEESAEASAETAEEPAGEDASAETAEAAAPEAEDL